MSLLIHSMADLSDIIFPVLKLAGCRTITEIGSESGGMTARLLQYVSEKGGWMTSIDPAPSAEAEALLNSTPFGCLYRDVSLNALPLCPPTDAYIVDGDHNYFTVLQELLRIEQLQMRQQKPFLALLHDVGWPCAYRDLYYNPKLIPDEWRHPFSWDRGLALDNPGTIEGGFRGCGQWACGEQEGGEHNGVLKAAEDLIEARDGALSLAVIPAIFGLGVMYSTSAPWSGELRDFLAPYDRNPLLEKLERNRLKNYLRVIELQDSASHTSREIEPAYAD
ncbi:MAG: class I SAM-dependent methyltransferase [Acidobacteriota bacterium]